MTKKQKGAERPGYVRVLISKIDPDTEQHVWEAKSGNKVVARVTGKLYAWIPTTAEAQAEAMEGASTTFTQADGTKVKVTGPAAPAARKFYSDLIEPIRGTIREDAEKGIEYTTEVVQEMIDSASPYTGRGGRRTPEVDVSKLDGLTLEELAAELQKQGIRVS